MRRVYEAGLDLDLGSAFGFGGGTRGCDSSASLLFGVPLTTLSSSDAKLGSVFWVRGELGWDSGRARAPKSGGIVGSSSSIDPVTPEPVGASF